MTPSPIPVEFDVVASVGPYGGPSYRYREAVIHTDHTGTRYELVLAGFPGSPQRGLGDLTKVSWVVDAWLDR